MTRERPSALLLALSLPFYGLPRRLETTGKLTQGYPRARVILAGGLTFSLVNTAKKKEEMCDC